MGSPVAFVDLSEGECRDGDLGRCAR